MCSRFSRGPRESDVRINRLDLTRYGKFTDAVVDFGQPPVGSPDMHVIYGLTRQASRPLSMRSSISSSGSDTAPNMDFYILIQQ